MKTVSPLIIGFDGTSLDHRLKYRLQKLNPAGVVFFKRNITSLPQVSRLIRDIRDLLGDIIVAIDHEGGIISRFPEGVPIPPSPKALRMSGDIELTRAACRVQAELLADLGFNMNFAPVVDLEIDPGSQVIGTRAYSDDADDVCNYLRIFWEEHQTRHVGVTIKHFPNHGRSAADSHTERGQVDVSFRELRQRDLLPYVKAVEIGIPAVMTAHLTFSAMDQIYPVSLSTPWIEGVLRKTLGFSGLVISDCVEMKAISGSYKPEEIVTRAMTAGMDLIISSGSLIKEDSFQEALTDEFERYLVSRASANGTHQKTVARVNQFTRAVSPVQNPPGKLIDDTSLIRLHQQTIAKVRDCQIPLEFQTFRLVEISNHQVDGINSDAKLSSFSSYLSNHFNRVVAGQTIGPNDKAALDSAIEMARSNGQALILLSLNGFRHPAYFDLMKSIRAAAFVIHIALRDQRDLTGDAMLEWVCWGENEWTSRAIVTELAARF